MVLDNNYAGCLDDSSQCEDGVQTTASACVAILTCGEGENEACVWTANTWVDNQYYYLASADLMKVG